MFFHILPVGLHWIFKTNAQENQLLYRWEKLGFKSLQDLSHITRLWREGLTSSPHAFQSQAAPPHLTYSSTWEMMPCRRCTVWGVSSLQPPHPGEVLAWPWLCREESCTEWKLDELPSTPWCCERMNCQNGLSFPLAPTWKLPQPRTYFIPIFHPAAKHAWLFATAWIAACQAPLSSTISWSLLKFVSIDSVKLSNYLTLCHPLLLLLPIFPNVKVFFSESLLHIRRPKDWSFSFSISPFNEYSGLIFFRMDWLDLLAVQGTLKSLLQHHNSKASILQHSAFFTV